MYFSVNIVIAYTLHIMYFFLGQLTKILEMLVVGVGWSQTFLNHCFVAYLTNSLQKCWVNYGKNLSFFQGLGLKVWVNCPK